MAPRPCHCNGPPSPAAPLARPRARQRERVGVRAVERLPMFLIAVIALALCRSPQTRAGGVGDAVSERRGRGSCLVRLGRPLRWSRRRLAIGVFPGRLIRLRRLTQCVLIM